MQYSESSASVPPSAASSEPVIPSSDNSSLHHNSLNREPLREKKRKRSTSSQPSSTPCTPQNSRKPITASETLSTLRQCSRLLQAFHSQDGASASSTPSSAVNESPADWILRIFSSDPVLQTLTPKSSEIVQVSRPLSAKKMIQALTERLNEISDSLDDDDDAVVAPEPTSDPVPLLTAVVDSTSGSFEFRCSPERGFETCIPGRNSENMEDTIRTTRMHSAIRNSWEANKPCVATRPEKNLEQLTIAAASNMTIQSPSTFFSSATPHPVHPLQPDADSCLTTSDLSESAATQGTPIGGVPCPAELRTIDAAPTLQESSASICDHWKAFDSFSRRAGDGYFRQKTAERPYDPSGKIHRLGIMQLLEMPTDESERSNEGPQSFPSEKSSSSNAKATSKGEPQQRGQQSEEPGGSQKTTKCPPDASAQSSAIGAQSSVITQLLGIPVDESERSHDEHRSVAADGALRMPCVSNAETTSLKLLSGEVQQQERLSGQPSRSHETDMTPSRSFRSTSVVVDSTILSAPQVIPEAIKSPEVMEVDDDSDRGSPDLYIIEESSYTPSAQRDTRKRPRTINASQESSVSAPARPESPEIEILCVVTPGSGVPPARPRNSDSRNSSGRSSMGDLELNELREQLLAARKPEKESELMEEPNSIQLLAAPDIEKKSAPTEEPETTESLKPENCSALLPPEVSPEGIPTELSESAHDTSHDEDALRLAALQSILAKRSQKLTKRPPSVSEAPLQSCEASEPKRKVSPSVFATLGYSSQPSNREEPIRKTLQDAPKWGQKSSTPERSLVIRPDRPRSSPHTASNYKRRRNLHPSTHFELSEDSVVRYTSSGTAYRTVTPKKPPKKRPLIELEEGEILEDISDEETGEEGTNEGLPSFDDLDLELMEEVFSDSEEKDSAALEEGEIESIGSSSDQESTLEPEDRLEADRPRSLDFSPAESRPSSRLTRPVSQLSAQGESRLSSFGRRSSLEKDNRKKRPFRYEVYFSPQASRSPPELARPVSQMSRRSDRLGFSLDHESFFGRENPREERRPQSCDFSALATCPSALTRPVSQASFRSEASLGFSSGRRRSRETERRPKEGRFQLSDYLTWTSRPSFELMRPFSQVSGRLDFFSDQEDSFRKEHRREERTFPPFDCSVMTSRPPTELTRTVSQMSVQSEVRLISISNQECSIGMEDQPNERRKQLSGHLPVTSRSLSGPATLTFDQNSACLSSSSGRENLTGAGNQPKEGGQQPFDLSAITSGPSAEPSRSVSQVSVRSADHLGPFADSSSNQETFAGTEDQSKENRSPLCRYLPQTSHASAELPAPTSNTAAPSEAPMNSSSSQAISTGAQNKLTKSPTQPSDSSTQTSRPTAALPKPTSQVRLRNEALSGVSQNSLGTGNQPKEDPPRLSKLRQTSRSLPQRPKPTSQMPTVSVAPENRLTDPEILAEVGEILCTDRRYHQWSFRYSRHFDFRVLDHALYRYRGHFDKRLCTYDLLGKCKDRQCEFNHPKDDLQPLQIVMEFIKEFPNLFGDTQAALEKTALEAYNSHNHNVKLAVAHLLDQIPAKEREEASKKPDTIDDTPVKHFDDGFRPVAANRFPNKAFTPNGKWISFPEPVFTRPEKAMPIRS